MRIQLLVTKAWVGYYNKYSSCILRLYFLLVSTQRIRAYSYIHRHKYSSRARAPARAQVLVELFQKLATKLTNVVAKTKEGRG